MTPVDHRPYFPAPAGCLDAEPVSVEPEPLFGLREHGEGERIVYCRACGYTSVPMRPAVARGVLRNHRTGKNHRWQVRRSQLRRP